MLGMSFI